MELDVPIEVSCAKWESGNTIAVRCEVLQQMWWPPLTFEQVHGHVRNGGVIVKDGFNLRKQNVVSQTMHMAPFALNHIEEVKTTWTYFSLHIWSLVINLGCVNEGQLSNNIRNRNNLLLWMWNTCTRSLMLQLCLCHVIYIQQQKIL